MGEEALKVIYNPQYAILHSGAIAVENITEDQLFVYLEGMYEEGSDNFSVQVWDTSKYPHRWETIC